MKKALSLLVALSLALALFIVPAVAEAEEPVTVNMFYQSSRPMNELTDLTRQYVRDTIGVDMNLVQGGDNWQQQLALYISGGDIPDLIAFMDETTFLDYAAQGVFYDITDIVHDYDNILWYLNSVDGLTADEALARTTVDGRIYGLPSITIAKSYYSTNIRTDWLNKLGLEIPVTLDEFRNVMEQFTYGDPDGDGKDNTYGLNGRGNLDYFLPVLRCLRRPPGHLLSAGGRQGGQQRDQREVLQGAGVAGGGLRRRTDRSGKLHREQR